MLLLVDLRAAAAAGTTCKVAQSSHDGGRSTRCLFVGRIIAQKKFFSEGRRGPAKGGGAGRNNNFNANQSFRQQLQTGL